MAVVSYPGVYIEEFTPGPPIEGVGTSTVAFVGTAEKGPVGKPTRLHSWDAFKQTFGDFVVGTPSSYLAPAVFGFFLNGGTDCFVLRAATALHSHEKLLCRKTGSIEPVLLVEARDEGVAGDSIAVEVKNASILDDALGAAASTLSVHIASSALTGALATGPAADRTRAKVADSSAFVVGETVAFTGKNADNSAATMVEAVVKEKPDAKTLVFEEAVPGPDDFGKGLARSADLFTGQVELRVQVPPDFQLARALPHGATVRLDDGTPADPDIRTVDTTTAPVGGVARIALTEGLRRKYDLGTTTPTVASLEFDLILTRPPAPNQDSEQPFTRLSMHPDHPRYWGTIVDSDWVTVEEPDQPPAFPDPDPRPKQEKKPLRDGADDDRAAAWSSVLTKTADVLGALDPEGELDIVCIPGATTDPAQGALRDYCERTRRFGILDSAFRIEPNDIVANQADKVRSGDGYVALYYPWVRAQNPRTSRLEYWPPSGHVAGVYARIDARVGVHAAPANDILRGTLGLERRLTNLEQGDLNLKGVNVLRVFPGQATPVVWGARTTALQNKYWQYINVRRLFLFIENSIEQNIQWAVFQPNNLALWQQLRRVISDFLTKDWKDGALFGATAKEAFYVRIDEALNPEDERALGRLHIEIGIAPTYPAEFIVVRIGIWRGGSQVSEG